MNEPDTPPVVSPFSEFGEKSSSSSKWKGYAQMAFWGVLAFVVLMGISQFIDFLVVGLLFIGAYVASATFVTLQINNLAQRLQYVVRSHDDIKSIRQAVNLNMKFAYIFMSLMYALLAAFLVTHTFICLLLLTGLSFIMTPFLGRVEKRFKAMKVEFDDPTVAGAFADILRQWQEPKFRLS